MAMPSAAHCLPISVGSNSDGGAAPTVTLNHHHGHKNLSMKEMEPFSGVEASTSLKGVCNAAADGGTPTIQHNGSGGTSEGKDREGDDKDEQSNEKELRENLVRLMLGDSRLRPHDELRIKVQYMDERFALNLKRESLSFKELEQFFQNRYHRQLNIYYTTSSKELMIQIKNQEQLDHVIQLYDRTGAKKRMRLILSQRRDVSENFTMSPLGVYYGICETALSDTSSILSTSNSSYSSGTGGRLARCPEDGTMPSTIETPRPPTSWREGRCLGRGAFGQVFVCLNTDTGEQLVVKKIYIRGNSRCRNRMLASLENEVSFFKQTDSAFM